MNRLLSKLRQVGRMERANGNGVSHVRVVGPGTRGVSRYHYVVTAAESAPCTCPDYCERDHDNE